MVSLRRLSLPWGLLGEPDMDINLPLELQVLSIVLTSGLPAGVDACVTLPSRLTMLAFLL